MVVFVTRCDAGKLEDSVDCDTAAVIDGGSEVNVVVTDVEALITYGGD